MHDKVKNSLMHKEGMSESGIEMHMYHNVTWWSARAHRSMLPTSIKNMLLLANLYLTIEVG